MIGHVEWMDVEMHVQMSACMSSSTYICTVRTCLFCACTCRLSYISTYAMCMRIVSAYHPCYHVMYHVMYHIILLSYFVGTLFVQKGFDHVHVLNGGNRAYIKWRCLCIMEMSWRCHVIVMFQFELDPCHVMSCHVM